VFEIGLMHRRILPAEIRAWYLRDLAKPLVAAMLLAIFLRALTSPLDSRLLEFGRLLTASCAVLLGAALAADSTREKLIHWWGKHRR
jgi:hypothetical protein